MSYTVLEENSIPRVHFSRPHSFFVIDAMIQWAFGWCCLGGGWTGNVEFRTCSNSSSIGHPVLCPSWIGRSPLASQLGGLYQDLPTGGFRSLTGGFWAPVLTRKHLLEGPAV